MSKRLDADIQEWAQSIVVDADRSGLSGINVVERILKDPGRSTDTSPHRVHWWPKNRRIAKMSRAMHIISNIEQVVLIVDSKEIFCDDGKVFTKYDLARHPLYRSVSVRKYHEYRNQAKKKLLSKLRP